MPKTTVTLGRTVPFSTVNRDKVAAKAVALAETFLLPAGIEFASFEHGGKTFALSARLHIEVDLVEGRLPHHLIREGGLSLPRRKGRRFSP